MKKRISQFLLSIAAGYPYFIAILFAATLAAIDMEFAPMVLGMLGIVMIFGCYNILWEHGQTKRLSNFFVEIKIPFLKRSMIAQKICKKDLLNKDCDAIFQEMLQAKQHKQTLELLRPNWSYVTFTHCTVIDVIKSSEKIDQSTYCVIMNGGKETLERSQKQLLGKRCDECAQKTSCRYRRAGCRKRNFALISFRTKHS